jgi:hypothetical protein
MRIAELNAENLALDLRNIDLLAAIERFRYLAERWAKEAYDMGEQLGRMVCEAMRLRDRL